MADVLRIFISHKMPTDTPLAQYIASRLALYGGNQVNVTHAGRFRYGADWAEEIERELKQAHWLIYLCTDQNEDWGFCLFECGYFRRTMEGDVRKQLITFCRKPEQISAALKPFNAVVISEESVTKLLEEIYLRDPWKVSPDLDPTDLKGTANQIFKEFTGSEPVEANFDIATSVTIEVVLSDTAKAELKQNRVPADVIISGTHDWQRLFGREVDTGGWKWHDLISARPYGEVYEYLIARMISDALSAHMPKGMLLRAANLDRLYRITLRRYERIAGNKYRFYFTAAQVDAPFFDLAPERGQNEKETILYHLINLSWFFRRRMVDQLYSRALEVLSMGKPSLPIVKELYDAIGSELMQFSAQAIIRGVDNLHVLQRALDQNDEDAQMIIERLETGRELRDHIFRAMTEGINGLHSVARDLYSMAIQNHDIYRKIAAGYARIAQELEPPTAPPKGAAILGWASPALATP